MRRRRTSDLLLVAGVALVVRLVYVWQLRTTPFFSFPIVDAEYHDLWAREILSQGIGHEGVFFRAPLYPYLLALAYAASHGSYLAARVIQAFLGTATAVLACLLGRVLTRRRSIGLIAGLGAALYGMLVYFDGELLAETLFTPLLLAAALAHALSRARGGAARAAVTGLLLGLAAITRPTALVLLPVLLADLFLAGGRGLRDLPSRRRLLPPLALLGACALVIAPVTRHNIERGDTVLIASQGGVNLWIGNNPEADGMHALLPGLGTNWEVPDAAREAERAAGRKLAPSEVSAWYARLAGDFMRAEPGRAALLLLRKGGIFWNRREVSNNRDLSFFRRETRILPWLRLLGFWLVGPLALWGLLFCGRTLPGWFRWSVAAYAAGVIVFFVNARYRTPLVPFLLIAAAGALVELPGRTAHRGGIPIRLGVLALLALFVHLNPWGIPGENAAHSHFALGIVHARAGETDHARREYLMATQADPSLTEVHYSLGTLAQGAGDFAEAEREYRLELRVNPRSTRALNNLGVVLCAGGRFGEGVSLFRRVLELEPDNAGARGNLERCLEDLNRRRAIPEPSGPAAAQG